MEGQLWPFHMLPASLWHALLMLNFHILSKHEFPNEYDNFKQKQKSDAGFPTLGWRTFCAIKHHMRFENLKHLAFPVKQVEMI